jgi:hypothetical protein
VQRGAADAQRTEERPTIEMVGHML